MVSYRTRLPGLLVKILLPFYFRGPDGMIVLGGSSDITLKSRQLIFGKISHAQHIAITIPRNGSWHDRTNITNLVRHSLTIFRWGIRVLQHRRDAWLHQHQRRWSLVHHLQQHRQGNFSAITQGGSPSEVLCTAHDSHTVARWEVAVRHHQQG